MRAIIYVDHSSLRIYDFSAAERLLRYLSRFLSFTAVYIQELELRRTQSQLKQLHHRKEKAMNTTENKNETTASEANQPQPNTNEEILSLLRTLVEQKASSDTSANAKAKAVQSSDLTDSETKRLLAELLSGSRTRPKSVTTMTTIRTTMTTTSSTTATSIPAPNGRP